jgi:hypothetical protein
MCENFMEGKLEHTIDFFAKAASTIAKPNSPNMTASYKHL